MPPDELHCAGCGCAGAPGEAASGWSLTRPPRPTGRSGPRTAAEQRLTMLCPRCARSSLRDLEARLD